VKELKRKAKKLGADEDHLDDLLDADDPRQEMIALILQLRQERPQQQDEAEPQEVSAAEEQRLRRKVKSDRAARKRAEKEREALRQEEEEAAEDERLRLEQAGQDEARAQEKEEQRRRMAEEKEAEAAAKRKAREELDSRERRADGLLSEAEALKLRQQEEEARLRRLSKSPSPRKVEARAAEAEADRSSRQRTRAFGGRAAAAPHPGSGRKWLNEHVYPTLRPSLVALDRCRPTEEHANPDFRMTPSKFLALCLSDPSFLAKSRATKMDHDVNTGLLTFMMSADEALRDAVQEVSRERPAEPLAIIARRLAD